jgi:hypothetical protein
LHPTARTGQGAASCGQTLGGPTSRLALAAAAALTGAPRLLLLQQLVAHRHQLGVFGLLGRAARQGLREGSGCGARGGTGWRIEKSAASIYALHWLAHAAATAEARVGSRALPRPAANSPPQHRPSQAYHHLDTGHRRVSILEIERKQSRKLTSLSIVLF